MPLAAEQILNRPEEAVKANVLLVDDLPAKLMAMEAVLSTLGENLLKASSGEEALRLLLKQEFAVIVLDVKMPMMDGFETAALIRQRKKTESTPIIFVTGIGGSKFEMARGYFLGAVDYIFSPIIPEVLKSKVRVFTELYRKTHQIKRMNDELEQKIVERTCQLEAANQELSRLNRLKSDFLSIVSHDIRTPLASIKWGIDIIRDGTEGEITERQGNILSLARDNIDRLDRMIDNVLNFNKIEAGCLDLSIEETELCNLTDETCRFMQMEANRKEIRIITEFPPHREVIAACDHDKIRAILINLIHNAVKFTSPGGQIIVRVERKVEGIRISVEDAGCGISPEDQERIFETFEQGALPKKKECGGFGLGLAIARKYMELHSGRIQVESEVGKGSKFILTFSTTPLASNPSDRTFKKSLVEAS